MWYRLTNNHKVFEKHKLTQIEYIKKVNEHLPGTLGGWIESEDNISQDHPFSFSETSIIFGKNTSVKTFCCLRQGCIIGENVCLLVSAEKYECSLIIEKSRLSNINVFVNGGSVFIDDTKIISENDSIVVFKNNDGKTNIKETVLSFSQEIKIVNNSSRLTIIESKINNINLFLNNTITKILKSDIRNMSNEDKAININQTQGSFEIKRSSLFFSDNVNITSQKSTVDIDCSKFNLREESTLILNDLSFFNSVSSTIENKFEISCIDISKVEILSSDLCTDVQIESSKKSAVTISTSRFFENVGRSKILLFSSHSSSINIFDSKLSDTPKFIIKNSDLLMQKTRVRENAIIEMSDINCEIVQSKIAGNARVRNCVRISRSIVADSAIVENVDMSESDIFGNAEVGRLPKNVNSNANLPFLVNYATAKRKYDFIVLKNKFSSEEELFCSYYSKTNPAVVSVLKFSENENSEYSLSELVEKQKKYAADICSSKLFNKIEKVVAQNSECSIETFKKNIEKEYPSLKDDEILFISVIPWFALLESIFNNDKSDKEEEFLNGILNICEIDFATKKVVLNRPILSIFSAPDD